MMPEDPNTVDVTIRIEKESSGRLDEVVKNLERLGLAEIERHDRFALINGKIQAGKMDALRSVKGVASIRADRTYRAYASPG